MNVLFLFIALCSCYVTNPESLHQKSSFAIGQQFALTVHAEECQPASGCTEASCCEPTGEGSLGIFYPFVDEFSKVTLVGSYRGVGSSNSTNVRFWVEVGCADDACTLLDPATNRSYSTARSVSKLYSLGNHLVLFAQVLIGVDNGKITFVGFDENTGCLACPACLDGDCGRTRSSIKRASDDDGTPTADSTAGDLTVYVAWKGTAAGNAVCTSEDSLPSRFQPFSFASIADTLGGIELPF